MGNHHHHHGNQGHGSLQFSGDGPEEKYARSLVTQRALRLALTLTLVFMIIEFLSGVYSNSLALISDAIHMLADSGALALALFANWLAFHKKHGKRFSQVELWAGLVSGVWVLVLAGALVWEAFLRLKTPEPIEGEVVIVVSVLGLIVNILSLLILRVAPREGNLNLKAAMLHVFFDVLGSFAALLSGVVVFLTQWSPIDAIASMITGLLVVYSAFRLIQEATEQIWKSR